MWRHKRTVDLVDTPEMDAFYDMLDHLNEVQFLGMRAAWHAIGSRAREDAWEAVREVGAREGLTREIEWVRDKARGWVTRGSGLLPYVTTDITWQQAKMEAGEAIVDAALAVALGNRLDPESHDTLIEPLLSATEPY